MLEGLAVWALFIYLLRLVGMPWNKATKSFAYLGGLGWLMFVWVGLINFTPMDLSGGSVVQSPHIQLRPDSTNVKGKVDHIYIKPNQQIEKGQLIYELDPTQYEIALNQANVSADSARVALATAQGDIEIEEANHQALVQDLETSKSQLEAAKVDYKLQKKMLDRYVEQNRVVQNTITESDIDKQSSAVDMARHNVLTLESQIKKKQVDISRAKLAIHKAELAVETKQAELRQAEEQIAKAQWDLNSTKVHAPADGFVTNFILREGQPAEFSSSVYPGKIFSATVEGIVEATGESQGNLLGLDDSVRATTGKNLQNKHHFVRLKIDEPEGYDIPVGSVGLAWVSGEKPIGFLAFLDVIRGIIIRMKSQLYFFYSI
ncbi:HlyD family secretion protein [Vibrio harveyi]|uniref:HlyD family secretion protein n=1 Tax=Vibrio harveyi TaxID=669 RepID=UPI003BB48FFD